MQLQSNISKELISKYLMMPYEKYFQIQSSQVLRNVMIDTNRFIAGVMLPMIYLVSEFLVMVGISLILISQMGIASLSIIVVFGLSSLIYITFSKKIIKKLGDNRSEIDQKIIKFSNEALKGIREIKLNKLEKFFISIFYKTFDKNAKILSNFFTFQAVPRLGVEVILVFFLAATMFFFVYNNLETSKIISTLALFGVAAIRLIPSVNKMITSYIRNTKLINQVEKKFDVEKELLLSLMGIETNFGKYLGKMDILSSLATLSYDKRRSEFFT